MQPGKGLAPAALGAPDEDITIIVNDRCSFLDSTKLDLDITPEPVERISGNPVTINLKYPVEIDVPIISAITGNPYIVSAQVIMRAE